MGIIRNYFNRSCTLGGCFAWIGVALITLTLCAHFYRAGEYGIALCAFGILVFLCIDSAWKQYAAAFFLFWGMIEWTESAYLLAKMRYHMEIPWLRGTTILVVVGLLTGFAGLYVYSKARKKAAAMAGSPALFQAIVFICTFLLIFYLRQGAKMNFLLLERYLPVFGSVQIFLAAWYAGFISGRLVDPKRTRKTRRTVWLIFGSVFFLQFFLGVMGFERMIMNGTLHVPIPAFILYGPVYRDSLSMMPVIVLVSTLLAGSAWCSMLCYFGPFDSLAAGRQPVRPSSKYLRASFKYGRVIILVTGCFVALGLRYWGLTGIQAISISLAYAMASLMIMAVLSRKYRGMIHCTTACPMGLVANLLGRLSPWRVKVLPKECDNCGICEKICKYNAITQESRASGKTLFRCSLCRDCITVCKKQAIQMHCPGLSPQRAWVVFAGLTTILHVIFLSVAMV